MLRFVLFLLVCNLAVCAPACFGESPPVDGHSTDEIVTALMNNNARRAAGLQAYTGTRTYEVDYQGIPTGHKHATMVVRVTYQAPHRKTFTIVSEDGSKLLLNRVLHKLLQEEVETNSDKGHGDSDLSRANYQFELLGKERKQERDCYIFHVRPLHKNKLLYDGKIWVDVQDFAVVHIEAQPAKPPSFWISETMIEHQYGKIGSFWLPAQNRSTSKVRFGGKALLTIDYKDYQLTEPADLATPQKE